MEPKHRGDGLKCKSPAQGISKALTARSGGMWLGKIAPCSFPHLISKVWLVLEVGHHASWTQDLMQYRPDPVLTAVVTLFWSRLQDHQFPAGLSVPCCLTCGRGEIPTFPPSRRGDSEVVSPMRATTASLFPSISDGTGPDWKSGKHIHISQTILAKSEPTCPCALGTLERGDTRYSLL